MKDLMIIPEKQLTKLYQLWLNNETVMDRMYVMRGITLPTSFSQENRQFVRKSMEPIKHELERRSRLVLK